MKKSIKSRFGLSLFFAITVFIIFIITSLIIGVVSFFLMKTGLIDDLGRSEPYLIILILLFASIIVGTIVSFVIGRVPLQSIRKVIAATNKLAEGDFSTRLDIKRPPEFSELADSFNRMAQELGSIEMLRTDFINNFSHEFKTPIVSIKGFAEILKKNGLTVEEKNEYLDIIIGESKRLASLATNVLNLAKVENQVILSDVHRFNISEQIRRCILMLETKWEEKNITLNLDIDEIFFTGNEEFLSQVWINLIDNAIKFTQYAGNILVSLKQANGNFVFSVKDNGCGIGADAAKHIFDKFYQADTSHTGSGNGLGLSLAKKIVELHQGTIICKSEENKGTEFVVSFHSA